MVMKEMMSWCVCVRSDDIKDGGQEDKVHEFHLENESRDRVMRNGKSSC